MGCGASKTSVACPISQTGISLSEPCTSSDVVGKDFCDQPIDTVQNEPKSLETFSCKNVDSDEKSTTSSTEEDSTESHTSPVANSAPEQKEPAPVDQVNSPTVEEKKGFVAFEVPLDDSPTAVDNALRRPLPKRLRYLEPLGNAPQITTEKLMEKLEKAEEKRKKALARYREKSSRRKELALKRNEQMGDVLNGVRPIDDIVDSEQSVGEKNIDNETFNHRFEQDKVTNGKDNQNNTGRAESPTSPSTSSLQDDDTSIANQNNNSIKLHHQDLTVGQLTRPAHLRYGCFLQAVQEEDEDGFSSDEDTLPSSLSTSSLRSSNATDVGEISIRRSSSTRSNNSRR